MSEQAQPAYIVQEQGNYAIVQSSIAAPPFPDIPLSLVYDIGDALKRVTRKLPNDQAEALKASLLKVYCDEFASLSVKLPEREGRVLWASFTREQCSEIAVRLETIDFASYIPFLEKLSGIEGYEVSDIIECLEDTKKCFQVAKERGYGIAFLAYE